MDEEIKLAAKPEIDQPVQAHSKWLMKKLYDSRDRNGDVTFVFREGAAPDIDIPVPSHALANSSSQENAEMKEEKVEKVKCHKQVITSQSAYFEGLMEFNSARNSQLDEVVIDVHEYSKEVFEAMIKFLYLGETNINSNDLVDMLNLSQEYLLPCMK